MIMTSHTHPPDSCIYGLREELSFCECNGTYIFLDAAADKYFGMVGSTATVFRSFVSGNALSAAEIETLHAAGITAPASEPVITMEMRLPLPLNQHEAALTGALTLGSGLIDQSQKITVAARATAEKKAFGHRS